MNRYKKGVIWLFIPLVYGLVNVYLIIFPPFLSQLVFGVFWFWVGMKFANLNVHKGKSFLIGNSIWAFSFVLFIWQFLILDDASRNLVLALFSQLYIQSYIWIGTKIISTLSNVLHGTNIMLIAYLSMFLTFALGFVFSWIKKR